MSKVEQEDSDCRNEFESKVEGSVGPRVGGDRVCTYEISTCLGQSVGSEYSGLGPEG